MSFKAPSLPGGGSKKKVGPPRGPLPPTAAAQEAPAAAATVAAAAAEQPEKSASQAAGGAPDKGPDEPPPVPYDAPAWAASPKQATHFEILKVRVHHVPCVRSLTLTQTQTPRCRRCFQHCSPLIYNRKLVF